ncbi:universal stress protein [Rathayibacter oskolensis]|uniref:universal stress protein n=1 Tax=Rathayibacter oskolensis TaxID=1891671 RepID=UPI003F5D51B6
MTPSSSPDASGTVVRPSHPRIVVGVDGSEHSRAALRSADRLAHAFDASIEAVAVWHYPVNHAAPRHLVSSGRRGVAGPGRARRRLPGRLRPTR